MFTGIVQELGRVAGVERRAADHVRLHVAATEVVADAAVGDSIAVDGCCLTVSELPTDAGRPTGFVADLMAETLRATTLGGLVEDDVVNLEPALAAATRLGGHLVQGHVDAVGEIVDAVPDLRVRVPRDLLRYLVVKGSVTVDGVSLTVVDVLDDGFTVAVIPHTAAVTTLGRKGPGDAVNLEVDVTVKYVERLLEWHRDVGG